MSGPGAGVRANRYGIGSHSHPPVGNWQTWGITITQAASTITYTSALKVYQVANGMVHLACRLTLSSVGTTANGILLSLPVDLPDSTGVGLFIGNGGYADYSSQASPPIWVPVQVVLYSTTKLALVRSDTPTANVVGGDPNIPAGSGDSIYLTAAYPLDA